MAVGVRRARITYRARFDAFTIYAHLRIAALVVMIATGCLLRNCKTNAQLEKLRSTWARTNHPPPCANMLQLRDDKLLLLDEDGFGDEIIKKKQVKKL